MSNSDSVSQRLPRHVAIIMDGNGRWAQMRHHARTYGHIRGAARVKDVVREAGRMGVKALTLFAFSTENWLRPEAEVKLLWKLFKKFLKDQLNELDRENVRLRILGETDRLSSDVREMMDHAVEKLSKNTGLNFNLAISYGSRKEILRAAQSFAQDCEKGVHRSEELTEELLEQYLWTADLRDLSDVDLVIRTSGEKRISNFLLWQAAYAEYVFFDLCWPDFSAERFRDAVSEFSKRDRRFGGLTSGSSAKISAGAVHVGA